MIDLPIFVSQLYYQWLNSHKVFQYVGESWYAGITVHRWIHLFLKQEARRDLSHYEIEDPIVNQGGISSAQKRQEQRQFCLFFKGAALILLAEIGSRQLRLKVLALSELHEGGVKHWAKIWRKWKMDFKGWLCDPSREEILLKSK